MQNVYHNSGTTSLIQRFMPPSVTALTVLCFITRQSKYASAHLWQRSARDNDSVSRLNDLIASSVTHHETKAMYENRGAFNPLIINFSAFYTALNHDCPRLALKLLVCPWATWKLRNMWRYTFHSERPGSMVRATPIRTLSWHLAWQIRFTRSGFDCTHNIIWLGSSYPYRSHMDKKNTI